MLDQFLQNRGPSPDFAEDVESLRDLIRKTVRASVEIQGGYHEGGGNQWSKLIVPGLVTLIVMGIGGGIAMYGQLSALTQKVANLQAQMDDLKRMVEPRYRGG